MAQNYATIKPSYVPEGFRLSDKVKGIHTGEFWGSDDQIAIRYRLPGGQFGLGAEITVCWAAETHLALTGTTGRAGTPVTVNGMHATYHDGMWMPGSGPDEVHFEPDGKAHWGRDLVHSITIHTKDGVLGVRAPRAAVPHLDGLVKIASSVRLPA